MKKQSTSKTVIFLILSVVLFVFMAPYLIYKFFGKKWMKKAIEQLPGNAQKYDPDQQAVNPDSPLRGKRILFLGSSVTRGHASCDVSFADYLQALDGVKAVKEAISGTTLVTMNEQSYIPRMMHFDPKEAADAFVCQLSTNDATKKLPLGEVSEGFDAEFDTSTVAGAIEYIIAYAKKTWNCPVAFYTSPQYPSPEYAAMVQLLYEIRDKWGITIIDLWDDMELNDISKKERNLYMADKIHPTKAGYLDWWLPKFEEDLEEMFAKEA